MVRLTVVSFLLALSPVFAQTEPAFRDGVRSGAEFPASCSDGALFYQTTQPVESAFFRCNSGNWAGISAADYRIFPVQSYGAKGDGVHDDQRAIQAAADAAAGKNGIVFLPSGRYVHSNVIDFHDGTMVQGVGPESVLVSASRSRSALRFNNVTNCAVQDLHTSSDADRRLSNPESAAILLQSVDGCYVRHVEVDGAGSVGVMVRLSTNVSIADSDVRNTMADGIHVVDASAHVWVRNNRAYNTGDDGFAAVAYQDRKQTDDVTFDNNVSTLSRARGVTCIGASNCVLTNNKVYSPVAHGIAVAYERSYRTLLPVNATLKNNLIRGVTRLGMNPLIIDTATDVTVEGTQIYDSQPVYINASTNVSLSKMVIRNAMQTGVYALQSTNVTLTDSKILGAGGTGVFFQNMSNSNVSRLFVQNGLQASAVSADCGAVLVSGSTSVNGASNSAVNTPPAGSRHPACVSFSSNSTVPMAVGAALDLTLPSIAKDGIVGAGLSRNRVTTLSPGGMFSVFGQNFASESQMVDDSKVKDGMLPTNVNNYCLEVGGVRTPLWYVSSGQIKAIAPNLNSGQKVSVEVISQCGTDQESRGSVSYSDYQETAPEFMNWGETSDGSSLVMAYDWSTHHRIGDPGLLGDSFTAAVGGETINIFLMGLGRTIDGFNPGAAPAFVSNLINPVTVYLDDAPISSNRIVSCTSHTYAGAYQLVFQLPDELTSGLHVLRVDSAGRSTPPIAVLAVRQP